MTVKPDFQVRLLSGMRLTPLWECPKCGRGFANRNQSHSCSSYTLRQHLAGKSPLAIALFRRFAKLVKRCGPLRVVPEKTRIAFQVRMSFAAVSLSRDRIVGHLVLARRLENPRFTKIENIPLGITSIPFGSVRARTWITKSSAGFKRLTALDSNSTWQIERDLRNKRGFFQWFQKQANDEKV